MRPLSSECPPFHPCSYHVGLPLASPLLVWAGAPLAGSWDQDTEILVLSLPHAISVEL